MKIGHVIHGFCSGGAETMVFGLARECALAGHAVEVIRLDKATGSLYEAKAVELLQEVCIATYSLDRKPGSSVFGLTAAAKLWLLAQRKQFDVIHSHVGLSDAFTGLVRQFSPAPFEHVLTVHSTKEIRSSVANLLCGCPTVVYCSRASARAVKIRHNPRVRILPNEIT